MYTPGIVCQLLTDALIGRAQFQSGTAGLAQPLTLSRVGSCCRLHDQGVPAYSHMCTLLFDKLVMSVPCPRRANDTDQRAFVNADGQ